MDPGPEHWRPVRAEGVAAGGLLTGATQADSRLRIGRALTLLVRLSLPYFTSAVRGRALLLLAGIAALALGSVGLNVALNAWNGRFFDALQARDGGAFLRELWRFLGLFFLLVAISVQRSYLTQALQIRWRQWQTDALITDWVAARLGGAAGAARAFDNPDQRIAEDVRLFTTQTLDLVLGLVLTAVNLVAFLAILWRLSAGTAIGGVHVPGLMLWAALAYALAGTALTARVGRVLVALNFHAQSAEADLRFSLAQTRVAITAADGPKLRALLLAVTDVGWRLAWRQKLLSFVTASYGQMTLVFPYLILAPDYLSGGMSLGMLTQSVSAFMQVQGALSWAVNNYAGLTAWQATAERLEGLRQAIAAPAQPSAKIEAA